MHIKCPECGHEVSDTAKTCPNCGFAVSDYVKSHKTRNVARNVNAKNNTNRKSSKFVAKKKIKEQYFYKESPSENEERRNTGKPETEEGLDVKGIIAIVAAFAVLTGFFSYKSHELYVNSPEYRAQEIAESASQELENKNYNTAVYLYEEAIDILKDTDKKNEYYYQIGLVYEEKQDFINAAVKYQESKYFNDSESRIDNMAEDLVKAGKYTEAENVIKRGKGLYTDKPLYKIIQEKLNQNKTDETDKKTEENWKKATKETTSRFPYIGMREDELTETILGKPRSIKKCNGFDSLEPRARWKDYEWGNPRKPGWYKVTVRYRYHYSRRFDDYIDYPASNGYVAEISYNDKNGMMHSESINLNYSSKPDEGTK